jgi:NodT family efflux transporter outer membrane factor (OMF) lipoprotein
MRREGGFYDLFTGPACRAADPSLDCSRTEPSLLRSVPFPQPRSTPVAATRGTALRRGFAAFAGALAGALLMAGALPGCAVGPDYRPPALAVPPAWSEAAPAAQADAAEALAVWWTRFGDARLDALVARALAANLELRVADARVREARALRRIAAAPLLPRLDAGADGSLGTGATTDLGLAGLDAIWEVDVFGGARRSLEAAEADLAATVADRRDLLVVLLGELARSYVELRGFQRRIDAVERNLASQRETRELTEAQLRVGLASDLDVERARALTANTAAELPPLDAALRASMHRIAVLVGQPPAALAAELAAEGPLPAAPGALVVGVPADLLRRRPDLARAERELAAATARIGEAKADLYPRFTLTGSVGLRSEDLKQLLGSDSSFAAIGPNVVWPIFAAGRIRANVEVQDARTEQALARYEQALLRALEQVENALVSHAREQLRRRELEDAVDANREAVELARRLYANGLGGFLDVLDAERSLLLSESRLVESETAVSTSLVTLYVALGGGWEQAEELRLR